MTTMNNGRPVTVYGKNTDNWLITDLGNKEKDAVIDWIMTRLAPVKTAVHPRGSYGLKHDMTRETGIYVSNNQFKDAMLMAGYKPENPNDDYWRFRISRRSPCFKSPLPRAEIRRPR